MAKKTAKENLIEQLENIIKIIEEEVPDDSKEIIFRPLVDIYDEVLFLNGKLEIKVTNDIRKNIDKYYPYAGEMGDYEEYLKDNSTLTVIDL